MPASSPELLARILEHLSDGVYLVDRDRRITYWNRGAERLTGFEATRVVGRFCHDNLLRHVDDAGRALCGTRCPLRACMDDGAARECLVWLHHAAGHRLPVSVRAAPLRDEAGAILGAVEVFSDASALASLEVRARELEALALLDPLTGLANRRLVERELEARLDERRRYGWPTGLLLLDVDHFKAVNDRWGHELGDEVLRVVARTLAASVRGFDTVGRWGGEEFVVLVRNADAGSLAEAAERLRALVGTSAVRTAPGGSPDSGGAVGRHGTAGATDSEVKVTVSVGGTLLRADDSMASAVARADAAMYGSKRRGRDCVTVINDDAAGDHAEPLPLPRLGGARPPGGGYAGPAGPRTTA